jgi:hypothetical protein
MIARTFELPTLTPLPRRFYAPVGLVLGALVLGLSQTPLAEPFLGRVFLFYVGTSLAYALLPLMRRGDIPLVAAWVVLFSELLPGFTGHLISAENVLADGLGVLMAAAPIYVARFRQIQQGDTRSEGRRSVDS